MAKRRLEAGKSTKTAPAKEAAGSSVIPESPLPPFPVLGVASRPKPDAAKLYAQIRKTVAGIKGEEHGPDLDVVRSAFAAAKPPKEIDRRAIARLRAHYWDTESHEVPPALRYDLVLALGGPRAVVQAYFDRWDVAEQAGGAVFDGEEAAHVATLSHAEIASLHAPADELRKGRSYQQRLAIANVLHERAWIRDLVPDMKSQGGPYQSLQEVVLLQDTATIDELVALFSAKRAQDVANALHRHRDRYKELLGGRAARYLEPMLATSPRYVLKELLAMDSPECARAFARHVDIKAVAPIAIKFFKKHPDWAAVALAEVASSKSVAADAAHALLGQLGLAAPPSASSEAASSGTRPGIADPSELPDWLREPRWKTKRAAGKSASIAVEPLDLPLVLDDSARAAWTRVAPLYIDPDSLTARVILATASMLSVGAAAKAALGDRPVWICVDRFDEKCTLFDAIEEPDGGAPAEEIMQALDAFVAEQPDLLHRALGQGQGLAFGLHAGATLEQARKQFVADGFEVLEPPSLPFDSSWRVSSVSSTDWESLVTKASTQIRRGHVVDVEELPDGGCRHTSVGTLGAIFDQLADEIVLPIVAVIDGGTGDDALAKYLVARFGDAAIEDAVRICGSGSTEVLTSVGSTRAALAFAKLLSGKKPPAYAREWLMRFPRHAAAGLIPVALAGRKDADVALHALRQLVLSGERDAVAEIAARYPAPVARELDARLSVDGLDLVPSKVPALPDFAQPRLLPPLVLRASGHALPDEAVESLLTMLAFSRPEAPYAGVGAAKELLDPRSAAAFAWRLFELWGVNGFDAASEWALLAVGHWGDDDCARRLTPLVRAWPGESAHARAVRGLDALALIGTDLALMHLHGIAQKLKFKALQDKARAKIDEIAAARGLTAEELADRLVPDLDLDDDGGKTLDFGPRQFRVSFDETLAPIVVDASKKRLADLPKPNKSDDAGSAAAAVETWKALKKDAKAVASSQVLRLEMAMCAQRRFSAETFQTFFVQHPLAIHLARRLVWGTYEDGRADHRVPLRGTPPVGRLAKTFRIDEGRALSGPTEETFVLDAGATVGLVHRLELDDGLAAKWGRIFSDYEIVQPFDQIGRATFVPAAAELDATAVSRAPISAKTGRVMGLEHRGWRKGPTEDGGWVHEMQKVLPSGLVVRMPIDGGICMGWMEGTPPEQKIDGFSLQDGEAKPIPLRAIGAVPASELFRDLEQLRD